MTGMSEDGRWFVRRVDGNWEVYDSALGETEPVRVMDDEPGLTVARVLARWEQERADDENLGYL
jgi:hypothetical protein